MNRKIITVILALAFLGAVIFFYIKCKPIPGRGKVESIKEKKFPANKEIYQIVKHKYFTLAYSEENEQPAWVCYTLKKENIGGDEPRSNNFIPDPYVSTQTADDIDYVKSGYDRGHMVPAADMSWSAEAIKESFYFSNISPQIPSFNRGIWKKLEEKVRNWAITFDSVKIYVGPVFKENIAKIGPDSVTVPGFYFKVILKCTNSNYEGIGFIFPNKKINDPIDKYAVSIDSVEGYTNLDFYNYLPDKLEGIMESTYNLSVWGLGEQRTNVNGRAK